MGEEVLNVNMGHGRSTEELAALVAHQQRHGGALVEYTQVLSFILVSLAMPRVVWVADDEDRIVRGLRYSLFTVLFGWWSLMGFFWSTRALIRNSMGGLDLTAAMSQQPRVEDPRLARGED